MGNSINYKANSAFFYISKCNSVSSDNSDKDYYKWKPTFLIKCTKLKNLCFWVNKIGSELGNYEQELRDEYFINQIKNSLEEFTLIIESGSNIVSSVDSIKNINYEKNLGNEIKRILKKSEILEENFHSFNEKTSSFSEENDKKSFKSNSFVFDYFTNRFSEENKQESFRLIKIYKNVTDMIEKHLKDKKTPFGYLTYIFLENFKIETDNKLITTNKKYVELYKNIIYDVKEWINILAICIYEYYNLKIFENNLLNKENILNFLTSLYFQNDEIYEYILALQKNIDVLSETKIINNLTKINTKQMNDLNINLRFLNENFFTYNKITIVLKSIEDYKSPLHKLKIIMKCASLIAKKIQETSKEGKEIIIEGDDILNIFIQIIIQSNISFLISHVNLIENFITNSLAHSITGYYLSTLRAAIKYIEEYDNS